MTRFLLTFTLALVTPALAQSAQPLAELAPAETVLTLGYTSPGEAPASNALFEDLAALDWAGETLEQLASYLEESDLSGDLGDLSDLLDGFSSSADAQNEGQALLEEFCPELTDERFSEMEQGQVDALLTVSVSPFNPVPAATALLRAEGEVADLYADLQDTLITCAEREVEVVTLEQGGVPLYVIGDGGDFPVIIGRTDDLFFAGSNPEVLRGVVRRAQGGDEPNFAENTLYAQTREVLEADGVSLSLNTLALAQVAENFGGLFVDGPELEAAFERGLAILRTAEGYAGSLRAGPQGLTFESLAAVNAEGGDPELAALLLCETCAVSSPFLAPETSVAVSGQYASLRDAFNYLQGVLDDLEPLAGESLDIRTILQDEFGFDIDTALLDWLGNEFYSLVLEPFSADLGTLFYGQTQAMYVPVTSREEAEAGLEELGDLWTQVLTLASETDDLPPEFFEVATETSTYNGVEVTRYRSSVNLDVGVAFLGNYLVVATPAEGLEPLIDTFNGDAPNIFTAPGYQAAAADFPENPLLLSYRETGTEAAGLADFVSLFSQPLAFGASVALAELDGPAEARPGYADLLQLTDLLPEALSTIAERVGVASGYGEVRESALYQRSTWRIDW